MNEQEKKALVSFANSKIRQAYECQDDVPLVLSEDEQAEVRLFEIALAALTAEPIYQLINYGNWYDAEKHIFDEAVERGDVARIVFRSATPAVNLAELVPEEKPIHQEMDYIRKEKAKSWNACCAEILRRIEEITNQSKPVG